MGGSLTEIHAHTYQGTALSVSRFIVVLYLNLTCAGKHILRVEYLFLDTTRQNVQN